MTYKSPATSPTIPGIIRSSKNNLLAKTHLPKTQTNDTAKKKIENPHQL